jgi:hypothetical protein
VEDIIYECKHMGIIYGYIYIIYTYMEDIIYDFIIYDYIILYMGFANVKWGYDIQHDTFYQGCSSGRIPMH